MEEKSSLKSENNFFEKVISHPYFQRLKKISQLGNENFVFEDNHPHNRYFHSIGTYKELCSILSRKSFQKLEINPQIIKKAKLLALCHDLGHGPFSHALDQQLLKSFGEIDFCHEKYSVKILIEILKDLNEQIDDQDFGEILLNGGSNLSNEIYSLISNKRFGVDVDRLDYLQRDSQLLNVQCDVNFDNIRKCFVLKKCPLEQNKDFVLCLKKKYVKDFIKFLDFRKFMFENFYSHPHKIGFSLIIEDIIKHSNQNINFVDRISNLEKFLNLNDFVVFEMLESLKEDKYQEIVNRFNQSKNYYFCARVFLNENFVRKQKEIEKFVEKRIFQDIEDIKIVYNKKINNFKDVDLQKIIIFDKESQQQFLTWDEYQGLNDSLQFVKKQSFILNIYCWEEKNVFKIQEILKNYFQQSQEIIERYEADTLQIIEAYKTS